MSSSDRNPAITPQPMRCAGYSSLCSAKTSEEIISEELSHLAINAMNKYWPMPIKTPPVLDQWLEEFLERLAVREYIRLPLDLNHGRSHPRLRKNHQ